MKPIDPRWAWEPYRPSAEAPSNLQRVGHLFRRATFGVTYAQMQQALKGNPNENYARELMELFSLGIGNYTEQDIREAARAFTGYTIKGPEVVFTKDEHDDGEKNVLGRKGKWGPDDIVRICLEQLSAPQFLAKKLYRFLVSETVPPAPELIEPLASAFRKSNFDFGAMVRTVLRSN